MLPGTSGAAANHRGDLVAVADGADAGEVTRALDVLANADVLTSENDTGPDDEGDATADTDMSTGERQSYSAVAVVESTTLPMITVHANMPHWVIRRVANELMPPRHTRRLNMMMHQRHNRSLGRIRPAWGRSLHRAIAVVLEQEAS